MPATKTTPSVTLETSTLQRETDNESVLLVTTAAVRTPARRAERGPEPPRQSAPFQQWTGSYLVRLVPCIPGSGDSQASCTSSQDETGQDGHQARSPASTHRAAGPRRPCPAARCRCRTSATARRRGTRLALAGRDRLSGRAQPLLGCVVPALGEAGAARLPVVDEDRQSTGVRVQRRGDPTDVPPVAGREQRQQPDRGVLGRVRAPGTSAGPRPASAIAASESVSPDRPGAQLSRGGRSSGVSSST